MRITPACAGNTILQVAGNLTAWDHPRLRGEYRCRHQRRLSATGSPPLARGIPATFGEYYGMFGITPACAGNTTRYTGHKRPRRDHPRLRGEYHIYTLSVVIRLGSPPLARGILHDFRYHYYQTGITPACAGNTYVYSTKYSCKGDHPRLRGEYVVL